MGKNKFFIPILTFGMVLSALVACGSNSSESKSKSRSESQVTTSESATSNESTSKNSSSSSKASSSSSKASSSSSSSSSSQAPVVVHVHDYEGEAKSTVKNADKKNVRLYDCKDNDAGKVMAIAFADYSEKSNDFDSAANASKYGQVEASLWDDAVMLYKSSNTTISWKVNVDKDITGAKLSFGITSTYDTHGTTKASGKFQVKVNSGEFAAWDVGSDDTYSSIGLAPTKRTYVVFSTINLTAGENVITLKQANQENRLLFGGDVKIAYDGDAVPVAAPVEGYNVTFAAEHCSILVFEKGQDYSVDPVPLTDNKTKARDEKGNIVEYSGEPDALEPQVNFKVVPEAGYEVDTSCIVVSGTQGTDWNSLKDTAGTEYTKGEGDAAEKVSSENTFRVTKIKGPLTITVTAVAEGTLPEGYVMTFDLENCDVKVYTNKNFDAEDTDTPYMSRAKGKKAPYPYCKGENAQFSFEVLPRSGYEFAHGLSGEVEADDVTFISPNGYNKIKVSGDNNLKFNMTKVSRNVTITIHCTLIEGLA